MQKLIKKGKKRLQTKTTYAVDVRIGESSVEMEERLQTQTIY